MGKEELSFKKINSIGGVEEALNERKKPFGRSL